MIAINIHDMCTCKHVAIFLFDVFRPLAILPKLASFRLSLRRIYWRAKTPMNWCLHQLRIHPKNSQEIDWERKKHNHRWTSQIFIYKVNSCTAFLLPLFIWSLFSYTQFIWRLSCVEWISWMGVILNWLKMLSWEGLPWKIDVNGADCFFKSKESYRNIQKLTKMGHNQGTCLHISCYMTKFPYDK